VSNLDKVKEILTSFIDIYKELLSILQKEREYLVNIDTENLLNIVELKQYVGLKIKSLEDSLKSILSEYGVESINEFLFVVSKDNSVDDIRILNGMLLELMDKFAKESVVNRMITNESISFYNSMVSMYMGFVKNQSENYDKDATIGITQRALSVKV
jgi:hypothetical protein